MVLLAIEIKCYDLLENNKVFNSKGCGGNKIVMAADDCFNLAAVFTTQPGVCGFFALVCGYNARFVLESCIHFLLCSHDTPQSVK